MGKTSTYKKEQLTDTAQNFFHLLNEFSKLKRTNEMKILIVERLLNEIFSTDVNENEQVKENIRKENDL